MLFGGLGAVMGGVFRLLAAPFVLGLVGYVYFLRTQAMRDRERRHRRQREHRRRSTRL